MKLNQLLAPLAIAAFSALTTAAIADESGQYQNCSFTPASAIGPMFDVNTVEECEAACKDKAGEGCTAWTFRPPSAMFPDKPGNCRMIKTIFKEEESARTFCGKI